jgi:GTPase
MKFVDEASIHVKAGDGGRGSASFRREKFVPKGGPDGGDGGKGGDVIVAGKRDLTSLLDFKYKRIYQAENGKSGGGKNKTGRTGRDVCLEVPLGTIVYDEKDETVLADVTGDGELFVVGRGGRGGRGNTRFTTSTHRAPTEFDEGEPGEERVLHLVLKLLADVGIVGLPNVGKSTLISRLTGARPRIGDYPFTTLTPTLGVFRDQEATFIIADIPGIVEGASKGRGLGLTFLRHIERTGMLLWVLDVSAPAPLTDYATMKDELASYGRELLSRKRILILNKSDLVATSDVDKWVTHFRETGEVVTAVSALSGQGLEELRAVITDQLAGGKQNG